MIESLDDLTAHVVSGDSRVILGVSPTADPT
jgi:hypothetical protein